MLLRPRVTHVTGSQMPCLGSFSETIYGPRHGVAVKNTFASEILFKSIFRRSRLHNLHTRNTPRRRLMIIVCLSASPGIVAERRVSIYSCLCYFLQVGRFLQLVVFLPPWNWNCTEVEAAEAAGVQLSNIRISRVIIPGKRANVFIVVSSVPLSISMETPAN